jgi:NAD(P)H-dependent flavin oxidoreductase YrpB (nitropropane dioxygenase family)
MGTRFLLTAESTVPAAVKSSYLTSGMSDTVVTTRVDGVPHRVLRTDLVTALETSNRLTGLVRSVGNARRFRKLTGLSWPSVVREGLSMRRARRLTWSQLVMAANTPMLLREGLVEGNTEAGVLASGQVVGALNDLPTCEALIEAIVTDATTRLRKLAADALG